MKSDSKTFDFTQTRLRGANDIFKKGGHVTRTYRDQVFRLLHDNRRQIVDKSENTNYDMSDKLCDSTPLNNKLECLKLRFLSRLPFTLPYNHSTSKPKNAKYKSYLGVAVRNFLKGYLSKEPCFGLRGDEFKSYKDLISFIYGNTSTNEIKLSKPSLSNLKHRKIIFKPVLKTKETLNFARYVKEKLPHFDVDLFLRS